MGKRAGIRKSPNTNSDATPPAPGILGSGIFGHIGGLVTCDSKDNSYFCGFMKFVTVLIYFMILVSILYLAYSFLSQRGFRILPRKLTGSK